MRLYLEVSVHMKRLYLEVSVPRKGLYLEVSVPKRLYLEIQGYVPKKILYLDKGLYLEVSVPKRLYLEVSVPKRLYFVLLKKRLYLEVSVPKEWLYLEVSVWCLKYWCPILSLFRQGFSFLNTSQTDRFPLYCKWCLNFCKTVQKTMMSKYYFPDKVFHLL